MSEDTQAGADDAQAGASPPPDDSIRASIERLIASGKDVAEAELAWAKIRGSIIARLVRRGMVFATVALACLTVALALLLVALVVAIMPYTGLLLALLIVSGIGIAGTAIFGLLARRTFKRLLKDEGE